MGRVDSNNEDLLRNKAFELEDKGCLSEAIEYWETMFKSNPDSLFLYHVGRLKLRLRRFEEAEQHLLKTISIEPRLYLPYVELAKLYEELDDNEKAMEYYKKGIALRPWAGLWVLLGNLQSRLDLIIIARESFLKAIELDSKYEEAYYNLALTYKDDDPNQAILLLRKAIELDPQYSLAYRELGCLLKDWGEKIEAEHCLRTAIALNKFDGWAYMYLGNLLWTNEEVDEAEELFKASINIWPLFGGVYWCLAIFYQYQDRMEEAKSLYEKSLELDPDDMIANYHFGKFLSETGEIGKAKIYLKRAFELDPDYEKVREALALIEGKIV